MILTVTAIIIVTSVIFAIIFTNRIVVPLNKFVKLASKGENVDRGIFFQKFGSFKHLLDMETVLDEFGDKYYSILEKSEYERNKLIAILESMREGIIAIDTSGSIIHINPAATRFLRLSEKQVVGLNYECLMKYYKLLKIDEIFDMLAEDNENPIDDILVFDNLTFSITYNHLRIGEFNGFIIVIDNISEEVSLESKQNEFLANVSHELKTPITTIMSYSETMLLDIEDNEPVKNNSQKEYLEIIIQESMRMSKLVSNLLFLNRIDISASTFVKSERDIIRLLEKCIRSIASVAAKNGQAINLNSGEKQSIIVCIDPDAIERAVLNILSNSLKYMPSGGLVNVDVIEMKSDVRVCITDTGKGIPEEAIPYLFDRFYRVDRTRSKQTGGTGLGLSIVKQIIDEHNGQIEIKSSLGKGTIVIITLPKKILKRNIKK
jgi:two-component system sensor histidine kinase VicK